MRYYSCTHLPVALIAIQGSLQGSKGVWDGLNSLSVAVNGPGSTQKAVKTYRSIIVL